MTSDDPKDIEADPQVTYVCVDTVEPDPGVHVVEELPAVCTECGADALMSGFGLAGGGMGSYVVCGSCDAMFKTLIPEEDC